MIVPQIKRQSPGREPPARGTALKSAWDLTDKVKALVYGSSGTGKTTFWATAPRGIKALVCSGGNNPGELKSIDTPENRRTIDASVIEHSNDIDKEISKLSGINTVVIDHASGLQDLILAEVLGLDEIPAQRPIIGDNQRTWGEVALQFKRKVRMVLNLPVHVIVVAQERDFGGDEGTERFAPTVGAALTPSITGWLNSQCDYILQTFYRGRHRIEKTKVGEGKGATYVEQVVPEKGVEYCMRTVPNAVYMAKFRRQGGTDGLPEVIVNPTFAKLKQLIDSRPPR
jgi:hypothetical protein